MTAPGLNQQHRDGGTAERRNTWGGRDRWGASSSAGEMTDGRTGRGCHRGIIRDTVQGPDHQGIRPEQHRWPSVHMGGREMAGILEVRKYSKNKDT